MVHVLIAGLSLIALCCSAAHAQVSATITDAGRDGVPDLVDLGGRTLELRGDRETRLCTEAELPAGPSSGIRWTHIVCELGPHSHDLRALRFELYEADGAITLEDFARPALATFVFESAGQSPILGHDVRIDVFPEVAPLIDAGVISIGVRMSLVNDLPGPWGLLAAYGFMLETPGSCPVCPIDWDGSGGVDVYDIGEYLVAWQSGAPCTDFDRSGGIDLMDLYRFLQCWESCSC